MLLVSRAVSMATPNQVDKSVNQNNENDSNTIQLKV
jgi:hypothetical protein